MTTEIEFPRDDFEIVRRAVNKFVKEHCDTKEQTELFMIALMLTTLTEYEIDVEVFSDRAIATHMNALASIDDVQRVLSKFMRKGDSNE